MTGLPLVGIIAGSGIDGECWLRESPLPATHQWQLVDPLDVPRPVSMLVWLWNPDAPEAHQRQDLRQVLRCQDRLLRQRGNRLLPCLFAANTDGAWRTDLQRRLRRYYARRLKRIVPPPLTALDRFTLVDSGSSTGERLIAHGQSLQAVIARWRHHLRRDAAHLLKIALAFTVGYLLILLLSYPWKSSTPERPAARPLLDWTWAEWQQHLDACRDLLLRIDGKHWLQLDRDTRADFSQYLRWLPVSHDLLRQRDPSRQSQRYQAEIEALLAKMQTKVKQWTTLSLDAISPPSLKVWLTLTPNWAEVQRRGFTQHLRESLLDNVFDPRPGATELHRLAEQFWHDDRPYTQAQLRLALHQATTPADQLDRVTKLLEDRLKARTATRVHAPHRKLAFLQELEQAIVWCQKMQKEKTVTTETFRQPSTPELIRNATTPSERNETAPR